MHNWPLLQNASISLRPDSIWRLKATFNALDSDLSQIKTDFSLLLYMKYTLLVVLILGCMAMDFDQQIEELQNSNFG